MSAIACSETACSMNLQIPSSPGSQPADLGVSDVEIGGPDVLSGSMSVCREYSLQQISGLGVA